MSEFLDKFRIPDAKATGSTLSGLWISCPDIDKKDFFVPHSQIDDDSEVWKIGDEGELIVSGWLADQRGWR